LDLPFFHFANKGIFPAWYSKYDKISAVSVIRIELTRKKKLNLIFLRKAFCSDAEQCLFILLLRISEFGGNRKAVAPITANLFAKFDLIQCSKNKKVMKENSFVLKIKLLLCQLDKVRIILSSYHDDYYGNALWISND
jgi:hypothetical protein